MLPSLPQTTMNESLLKERVFVEEAPFMAAAEEMQSKTLESGDPATDRMMGKASSSREGPVMLQWGQRKRPRCSRVDNHLKHSTITDEPTVLLRKTVRVKAEKVAAAGIKNGLRERPRLPPPTAEVHAGGEEGRKRAKISRGGTPDLAKSNRGTPSKEIKGAYSHAPSYDGHKKNSHLTYVSKSRMSPDHNTSSPCRSLIPNGGGIEIAAAKIELDWPKFLISLSRKEKEDDFYIIKGTKLPQRPKRRPKVVERALHFCTPGSWLTDLSRGRYDVREKKCVKKKPRGLKAMESMDSDSE